MVHTQKCGLRDVPDTCTLLYVWVFYLTKESLSQSDSPMS